MDLRNFGDLQAGSVLWGDAISALESDQIAVESVDLIFADPPYNIGKNFSGTPDRWPSNEAYAEWCYKWLALCLQKLKPSGTLYVMSSTQCMPHLDVFLSKHTTILARIVWHYDSSGVQAKKYFGSAYEPILMCVKNRHNYTFNADEIMVEARTGAVRKLIDYRKAEPTPYKSKKVPHNVWYFPRVRYRMPEYEEHPTQKPERLLERVILASSKPGDLVLDPFAGTFTACAVARRLGRRTIGIEAQREYIKIGLRRLGIAAELDGDALSRPKKQYRRINGRGNSQLDAGDQKTGQSEDSISTAAARSSRPDVF